MSRSDVFMEVYGFDETLAEGFNDTDYCMRVGRLGYKILNDANAVLHHYSSRPASRQSTLFILKTAHSLARWRKMIIEGESILQPPLSASRPGPPDSPVCGRADAVADKAWARSLEVTKNALPGSGGKDINLQRWRRDRREPVGGTLDGRHSS